MHRVCVAALSLLSAFTVAEEEDTLSLFYVAAGYSVNAAYGSGYGTSGVKFLAGGSFNDCVGTSLHLSKSNYSMEEYKYSTSHYANSFGADMDFGYTFKTIRNTTIKIYVMAGMDYVVTNDERKTYDDYYFIYGAGIRARVFKNLGFRAQFGFNTSELTNNEPYDQLDFLATYTF
ncbi:outer membrane beta-barrel protein [Vibrio rotiferianus]|uniref:outer membrane beta-barrel protein n=1 Tax=Vibrio rotiferianus TaxID=190895 RepID=UPI00406A43F0